MGEGGELQVTSEDCSMRVRGCVGVVEADGKERE